MGLASQFSAPQSPFFPVGVPMNLVNGPSVTSDQGTLTAMVLLLVNLGSWNFC